jgi:hypothetical protein
MTHDLNAVQHAERVLELENLWGLFDPLNYGANLVPSSYAQHVEPLLRVLEGGGDEQELATEIRIIMQDFMNLDWSTEREAEANVFATRVMAWWNDGWADSRA